MNTNTQHVRKVAIVPKVIKYKVLEKYGKTRLSEMANVGMEHIMQHRLHRPSKDVLKDGLERAFVFVDPLLFDYVSGRLGTKNPDVVITLALATALEYGDVIIGDVRTTPQWLKPDNTLEQIRKEALKWRK